VVRTGPQRGHVVAHVVLRSGSAPRPSTSVPRGVRIAALLVSALAALVAAFAWLLTAMDAAALAGMCVVLLASLAVVLVAGRAPGRGGRGVTVISNINVKR